MFAEAFPPRLRRATAVADRAAAAPAATAAAIGRPRLRRGPRVRTGLSAALSRRSLRPSFGRVDFLEIIADHYFDAAPEKLEGARSLRAHFPLVAHGLDLSIGSAEGVDAAYLEKLARSSRASIRRGGANIFASRARAASSIGHLAALPYTREAVDVVARNVDRVRKRISTPLVLENITTSCACRAPRWTSRNFSRTF